MSKKEKSVRDQIAEHEAEIAKETDRWNHLREHGGSDPFWSDGVNMNLVRNHIIYHLMKIQELSAQPTQLSMFDHVPGSASAKVEADKRVPPKMPQDYMANERRLLV